MESDYLILIECPKCGQEHYFELDSLPGGLEHCEYCEACSEKLLTVKMKPEAMDEIDREIAAMTIEERAEVIQAMAGSGWEGEGEDEAPANSGAMGEAEEQLGFRAAKGVIPWDGEPAEVTMRRQRARAKWIMRLGGEGCMGE